MIAPEWGPYWGFTSVCRAISRMCSSSVCRLPSNQSSSCCVCTESSTSQTSVRFQRVASWLAGRLQPEVFPVRLSKRKSSPRPRPTRRHSRYRSFVNYRTRSKVAGVFAEIKGSLSTVESPAHGRDSVLWRATVKISDVNNHHSASWNPQAHSSKRSFKSPPRLKLSPKPDGFI